MLVFRGVYLDVKKWISNFFDGFKGDSRDPQTPIRIPKDMGIVWEAYHKGVPLLGVPENPTDGFDDNF